MIRISLDCLWRKENKLTHRRSPIIGNNVTIYANSVIVGGITIGDNATIGAGSIVVKDVREKFVIRRTLFKSCQWQVLNRGMLRQKQSFCVQYK